MRQATLSWAPRDAAPRSKPTCSGLWRARRPCGNGEESWPALRRSLPAPPPASAERSSPTDVDMKIVRLGAGRDVSLVFADEPGRRVHRRSSESTTDRGTSTEKLSPRGAWRSVRDPRVAQETLELLMTAHGRWVCRAQFHAQSARGLLRIPPGRSRVHHRRFPASAEHRRVRQRPRRWDGCRPFSSGPLRRLNQGPSVDAPGGIGRADLEPELTQRLRQRSLSGCLLDEQVGDPGRRLEDGAGLAKDEVIDLVSGDRSHRGAKEHAAIRRLVRRMADMLPFTASIGATQLPPAEVAYREYVPASPRQAAPSQARSRPVKPSQAKPSRAVESSTAGRRRQAASCSSITFSTSNLP